MSYAHHDVLVLKDVLTVDNLILIKWFFDNQMQANPDKFQALVLGLKAMKECLSFNLGNICVIQCEKEVKLLGVTIDFKLSFNSHISNICEKRPLGSLEFWRE